MSEEGAVQLKPGDGLTCFVIGPIGSRLAPIGTLGRNQYEDSTQIWENLFEPACAQLGLRPLRADKLAEPGEIPEQIFLLLRDADVVIADLSGGNPNVMYELGLRHTRDKITIQVGEYERLPFDVNTIRTIQFRRSEAGLIDARGALVDALTAALDGRGSPVAATRIWTDLEPSTPESVAAAVARSSVNDDSEPSEGDAGFIDVLAEGEQAMEQISVVLGDALMAVEQIAALVQDATTRAHESDQNRGGFVGRLKVAQGLSDDLRAPSSDMENKIAQFLRHAETTDTAVSYLLDELERSPEELVQAAEFLEGIISMASAAKESTIGVAAMMQAARDLTKISRSLAQPSKIIHRGLGKYLQGSEIIVAWRDRAEHLLAGLPGGGLS